LVGVDLSGPDRALDLGRDLVAAGFAAAGETDLAEDFGAHRAFVGDDAADAAGSDDKDFLAHVGKCFRVRSGAAATAARWRVGCREIAFAVQADSQTGLSGDFTIRRLW